MPLVRRYEVAGLALSGELTTFTQDAPATPMFEEAFCGFARGTLIATAQGRMAVEDLVPGMNLETADNGPQKLLWIGSTAFQPDQSNDTARLTRITADSFGVEKPSHDLMLGPRARILFRHSNCQALFGTDSAFAPARAFVDGVNLFTVMPASRVRVYHLALHGQQILCANGLEVESYHPGQQAGMMIEREMQPAFLSLFPHVTTLDGFGPITHPRLTAFELEGMRAD